MFQCFCFSVTSNNTKCGPKVHKVIFSQSSDILERQSSMASSTEEMSAANNDLSGGSRRDDATADFGVFKDFDFLEYESESIEGESTDNFNWGVRRRPLSEGEEEQPSLRQLEDSISEQTPVLTVRKVHVCPFNHNRVGAEESSDDEVGSESPLDEIAVAPEFENSTAGAASVFPPSSLSLTRRDSSARSDTSGSSAGDLGDVTPCNASPGLASMRPMTRSDTVETWSFYVQTTLSQNPTNPLLLFHQLQKLIKSISNATIAITQESCSYLCQSIASSLPTVKIMSSRLSSMVDIVTHRVLPTHFVWFSTTNLNNQKLLETLKYGMLEVQEHLDTFCDKREQATMYSDSVKTSLKLELLSGQHSDTRHEDYLLDLGKALYKLHFQLLLLIEAANKMVSTLSATLKNIQYKDVTNEIILIKSALARAIEDTEADGGTPTPISTATSPAPLTLEDLENSLYELLTNEKWPAAISLVKHHRGQFSESDGSLNFEDDIVIILNTYCKRLVQERSDCYVITNQDGDMGDVFVRLFQLSSAVQDLEGMIKDRDQSDVSVSSQPKE